MEIVEIKEEEEDPIEALEEYSAMLNDLGNFAHIVQINTLSMVAEDYKSSTSSSFKIYKVIRTHLLKKIHLLLVNYRWCMSWIRY
mmetsp:Transcript_1727/g.2687  ORF Transcript_1727/g.2687 Transcript_1727/m.2687 type:complete len:85 (-) Transcript_1727:668-922(-)